jgi:hypothetical protein
MVETDNEVVAGTSGCNVKETYFLVLLHPLFDRVELLESWRLRAGILRTQSNFQLPI